MKHKIVLILGNPILEPRKQEILKIVYALINKHDFPFDIKLFDEDLPSIWYEDCKVAITAFLPKDSLRKFVNLKLVISLNAGVEDIISQIENNKITVIRTINESSIRKMQRYVLHGVIESTQQMYRWRENQKDRIWDRQDAFEKNLTIGVMGLGNVGQRIANSLKDNGFSVIGYSKTIKELPYKTFIDLADFLSQVNILVNALPLTTETREIINKDFMSKLPSGAVLINIGRGAHIQEEDLIEALNSGQLSHTVLDVFTTEPLPETHPFWSHTKISTTPHISGVFNIMENLDPALRACNQFIHGDKDLMGKVDIAKGY